MALYLLDTPVRLTWDFSTDPPSHAGNQLEVARHIADGGVFFVTLQGQPLLQSNIGELLRCLTAGGCQVLIACSGTAVELSNLAQVSTPIHQLLLDAARFIDVRNGVDTTLLQQAVQALRAIGYDPALMLTPQRRNLHLIPEFLRFCRDNKVGRFKLPNANIGDSFREYSTADLPRHQDLELFRKLWAESPQPTSELPALDIHDLFLWEILVPGQLQARSEYGGCQAGNSLGHVDLYGMVHPCAAWPEPLGNLVAESLFEVWSSPARFTVREQISVMPVGCRDCCDIASCLGGCRGLSRRLNQAEGERDLMCPGPRRQNPVS